MEYELKHSGSERRDEVQRLCEDIGALRHRVDEYAKKTRKLSWDTELLIRKAHAGEGMVVSCVDPDWERKLVKCEISAAGMVVTEVRTEEQVRALGVFASRRDLVMTGGRPSIHLGPR